MASPHAACTLHILFARGTVDEYVIEIQKSKKGVFERILGSAGTVGLLEEGKDLGDELDQIAVGLGLEIIENQSPCAPEDFGACGNVGVNGA